MFKIKGERAGLSDDFNQEYKKLEGWGGHTHILDTVFKKYFFSLNSEAKHYTTT
jgi:hypothetical protein